MSTTKRFFEKLPPVQMLSELWDALRDLIAALQANTTVLDPNMIIAEVRDYAGDPLQTAPPSKWLYCFGQEISRATYSALFAVVGTTYGVGNGTTTFNIPDCRGRVVAGRDNMGGTSANRLTGLSGGLNGDTLGATGGLETHILTEAQLAAHGHPLDIYTGSIAVASGNSAVQGVTNGTDDTLSTNNAGTGVAHNNVQPTIVFHKIIFTGVV